MANVMSFKNVKNKPHRSAFDLSYKNAFTAKVGELLPCFVKEVLPGDVFHLDASHFSRTAPVNTAAFTRIRENVDFFFVPYRLLWDKWTQFIAMTNDPHYASSPTTSVGPFNSTPFFRFSSLNSLLTNLKQHDGTGSLFAVQDAADIAAYPGCIKLLQYLGYGALTYARSAGNPTISNNTAFSLFRLAAYQKIYYDYFRNSQWESSKPWTYNFDYMFTNGSLELNMNDTPMSSGLPFDSIITLRYANYAKDLTMGLNPSAQFGDTAIAGPVLGNLGVSISNVGSSSNSAAFVGVTGGNLGTTDATSSPLNRTIVLSSQNNSSGISVLAIRLAESLQKYREITLTGSKDYRDQIEKHWGVSVPDYASDLCERVFSYDSMIEISEVVSNNLADSEQNANIKGKGISASNGKFTWKNHSNDYGVLMGIYHAEPLLDYQSDLFVDRQLVNTLPSSFPIPELDSIGMEAVPQFCIYSQPNQIIDERTVGYAPRYFEYKTSRDIVNGGFGSYGKLMAATNDFPHSQYNGGWSDWVSAFGRDFAYKLASGMVDYRTFKIQPHLLNPVFTSQVSSIPQYFSDSDPYPSYESDQLLVKTFFDCKVIRNLSYDGLPY